MKMELYESRNSESGPAAMQRKQGRVATDNEPTLSLLAQEINARIIPRVNVLHRRAFLVQNATWYFYLNDECSLNRRETERIYTHSSDLTY